MGISFKAKVIDSYGEMVAQFELSNYRAWRVLLSQEEINDYGGNKEMETTETLQMLKEVKKTFTQHGYPQDHHGPSMCNFLERYLQTFSTNKVILEWG